MNRSNSTRSRALAEAVEGWFAAHGRDLPWRRSYDPWQVWVSEIMLQQTRMEVVLPYFERFIERYPTVESLAAADEAEVVASWSGLGYYRRARMLHQGARWIASRGEGVPRTPAALEAVPGIGRYTAGAVASIAFEVPAPIVDGNVARVAARLEAFDEPLGSSALLRLEWAWATRLVEDASSPRALNQGLMELGARICRPRAPLCPECPLAALCVAHAKGEEGAYPRKKAARRSTDLHIPLFLVDDGGGRVLLELQSTGSLMTGMWHLPHGSSELLPGSDAERFRRIAKLGSFRHTITHRRIRFELWEAELSGIAEGPEASWIAPEELVSLPHPSYVRKALTLWRPFTIST
ncbi:MAG: A/G-specific adenine glycosylase [Thermoanaerobaculia bacterium]